MEQKFDPMTGKPIANNDNPFANHIPTAPAAPAQPAANPYAAPTAPTAPAVPAQPTANPYAAPAAPTAPAVPAQPTANPYAAPAAPTAPAVPTMPTMPSGGVSWPAMEPKKSGKKWLWIVLAVLAALAIGVGAYFAVAANNPKKAISDGLAKTFNDFGQLGNDLRVFTPDTDNMSVEIEASGKAEDIQIDINAFALRCDKKYQMGVTAKQVDKKDLSVLAELNDSQLKMQLTPVFAQTFVYDYKNEKDGYLSELLDEYDFSQKDVNKVLDALYNLDTEGDSEKLAEDIKAKVDEFEFEKIDAKNFTVDGESRKCKGYSFEFSPKDAADFLKIFRSYLKDSMKGYEDLFESVDLDMDDVFADLDDEIDSLKESDEDPVEVKFYLYKGAFAAIQFVPDEGDTAEIRFLGGDFRLQNVEIYSDDDLVGALKGEKDGKVETYTILDEDEDEVMKVTYASDTGKTTVEIDEEDMELSFTVKATSDSLTVGINSSDLGELTEDFDGELTMKYVISSKPKLREFAKGEEFDVAAASENDFEKLGDNIDENLKDAAIIGEAYSEAMESSRQRTDLANVRALKSLVVTSYFGESNGKVRSSIDALKAGKTVDFYLSEGGQEVTFDKSKRMEITADWDGCHYGKYIKVTVNKDCEIVSSEPDIVDKYDFF